MPEELKKALELLTAHKDDESVKTELKKLVPVSVAEAFELVEKNEDGKKLLNSFADKRVTSGIATAIENFKKKDVPGLIADALKKQEEAFKKDGVELSESDKKLLEINKEVENLKRKNQLAETKAALMPIFASNNLDLAFVDYFVGEDKETAIAAATTFSSKVKDAVKQLVDNEVKTVFQQIGYDPNNPSHKTKGSQQVTTQMLEAAKEKAMKLGTIEARAEYAQLKQTFESQSDKKSE